MTDKYQSFSNNLSSPATNAIEITPDDSNDLAQVTRAIYIGGSGNMVATLAEDSAAVTFVGLVAGSLLPLRVKRVKATDTTATNIVGVY